MAPRTWWWSAPWTGLSRPDEARTAARCLPAAFRTYTLAGSARSHSSRDASFAESYLEALRLASVPE
jgi:hypothetical protein